MSLTANFDYCVQLGIESTREIFHLAFKSEDRYPHNIGPLTRVFSGRTVHVEVRVLDDEDARASLRFADPKHIAFSFPFEISVTADDSPDPALSRITMLARVEAPGELASWEEEGSDVLGLSFFGITPGDVVVQALDGLPSIDVGNFAAAVHAKYDAVSHVHTYGTNVLVLYDGNRDTTLEPPNAATPYEIQVELHTPGGAEYLKVTLPIHVRADLGTYGFYESYGRTIFHREVVRTDTTITVSMGTEPVAAALKTVVELDNAHPARNQVIAQLTPMVVNALAGFGTITEPALGVAAAEQLIRDEVANYLSSRRYPVYTPVSGDPAHPLGTPVGFLLVAEETLAILLNRRDSSVADFAPDTFRGARELALAVGRAKVDEVIQAAIDAEFPGLASGGHSISTDEGDATLESLSVVPASAGSNGQGQGHLWVAGEAEVHIDCWPDPDVSFAGPIFVDATSTVTDDECTLELEPRAGDFDIDQSCCDVFLQAIIPIVGWIMFFIVESTIDEVGGELITEITEAQGDVVAPIPPTILGIAEVRGCLLDLIITSGGFILPGEIHIRRLGTSFEDRAADRDLPRP
jgi:hypothetical protein